MLSNDVFDKVYTLLLYAMRDVTKLDYDGNVYKPYEELNIARSIRDDEIAELPCLSARQIGAIQVGNDLEHKTQNAVESTFQLDSYSNISYEEAFDMINDAGDIMAKLGYSLTYGVEELSTKTIWRFVARFSRIVGASDVLTL